MAEQKKVTALIEGIYEVKDVKRLNDGIHKGVIVDITFRHTPYEYTDLILESEGIKVKVGYPSTVSKESKLGKLFERFGINLKVGEKVDIRSLVGKTCQFQTTTTTRNGKEYSNVLEQTLKP